MKANMKQTNQINNNDYSESFLSDQSKSTDIEVKRKQTKNKRKGETIQKLIFQIAIHTEVSMMIHIEHVANSNDQKLNGDEYGK